VRKCSGESPVSYNFAIECRYSHRKRGPEGRTLRIDASNVGVAIARGTREFLKSLDRKERFDAAKRMTITVTRLHKTEASQ
jgi:hypothetical protein